MKPKHITAELLLANQACSKEVERFDKVFPDGTNVTMRAFAKADKLGFSVDWLVKLLSDENRTFYRRLIETKRADLDKRFDEFLCDPIARSSKEKYAELCATKDKFEREYGPILDKIFLELLKEEAALGTLGKHRD